MKKFWMILLAAALLVAMFGCTAPQEKDGQTAFYYKRAKISYGEENGVITAEYRSPDTTEGVLSVLNVYVDGPKLTELANVFPLGCEVLEFTLNEKVATVHFNKVFGQLQGVARTLACVCMSRTVMELTGAETVRISIEQTDLDGAEYLEFDANGVMYFDSSN